MLRLIIILIGLVCGGAGSAQAVGECGSEGDLIVTSPRSGARTLQPAVTVRGYLCRNYPLILIRNQTTKVETLTETREICEASECAYHFATPVRGLELGENRITAEIPGEDMTVEIEVIRTALASSASHRDSPGH